VQGAGVEAQFGVSLADTVAADLGARNALTVSRDLTRRGEAAGARLMVGGEIARNGDTLRVHAHIDDAQAGVILWSADFERPVDQAGALQDTTATKIADLIDLVRRDAAAQQAQLTPESLAALMHAEDISRLTLMQKDEEKRAAWRRVATLAPRFATAHAELAFFDLIGQFMAPARAAELRGEAEEEIKIALKLDPHCGAAYVAASFLPSYFDWAAQEDWLLKGLAANPDHSQLNYMEADLIANAGRMSQSLSLHERALEGDPLSRSKTLGVVFAMMGVGRYADARALSERARRTWTVYSTNQIAELTLDLIYGDEADGKRALDAAEKGELPLTREDVAAWRQVLDARAGRRPAEAAAKALVRAAQNDNQLDLGLEIAGLSSLHQADMAFDELDRRLPMKTKFFLNNLFQPATADLRRSPRFMPLAASLGMTRYWLATGRWPDYCRAADRPYDCQVAAKAAANTPLLNYRSTSPAPP
jgi:hypothetical protein